MSSGSLAMDQNGALIKKKKSIGVQRLVAIRHTMRSKTGG
jgi:hypothetical protein